ncbi:MAG: hypothetical protein FWD46_09680, partial [Cystobacterineae bacterium]|nr:hypothetical protein [Cystobacterineae bacterium]
MDSQKRLILAILSSMLLVFAWTYFFAPKNPPMQAIAALTQAQHPPLSPPPTPPPLPPPPTTHPPPHAPR